MGWLQDNLGMVVLFAVVLLAVLLILGSVSGRLPEFLDSISRALGLG